LVRTASPSCAARKALTPTSTIAGRRTSWRLAGDTAREATSDKAKGLRAKSHQLKNLLAELMMENRLLKKGADRRVSDP